MTTRRTVEDFQRDMKGHRIQTTPGDEERKQRILANGRECLRRLHGNQTWEDWMGTGAALEIITEEAMGEVGATEWDPDNKRLVKEFTQRWEEYEIGALGPGSNYKPISKQERWALREVMTNPEIGVWYGTLPGPQKRRVNHPNAVINKWKASTQIKERKEDGKPTLRDSVVNLSEEAAVKDREIANLKAHIAELEAARKPASEAKTLLGLLTEVVAVAQDPANWPPDFPLKAAASLTQALFQVRAAVEGGAAKPASSQQPKSKQKPAASKSKQQKEVDKLAAEMTVAFNKMP